ncbi:MAG TPA: type II toxin-antitoxin system RelE/ParE family toxin [Phototrophicaceae bacterium]|nr:type II toxin-antitoxin system RelE/ParE family toxin [Phototrophicaceae bacterium]
MPEVVYAESFFKAVSRLQKRYPHAHEDVEALADRLEAGELPGDRVQGLPFRVYKVRVKNRDVQRGKSGGYRVIYYLETAEQIVIISIYSKSDQSDIPTQTIRQLVSAYQAEHLPKK